MNAHYNARMTVYFENQFALFLSLTVVCLMAIFLAANVDR